MGSFLGKPCIYVLKNCQMTYLSAVKILLLENEEQNEKTFIFTLNFSGPLTVIKVSIPVFVTIGFQCDFIESRKRKKK